MLISKKNSKTKVGLLFGSFNPIHIGHLIISSSMIENGALDKVCFVVTPQSPFKKSENLLHHLDRYDLVKAAIADDHKLEVSDIEFDMPQPHYTAHTLALFMKKFPNKKFVLIMGEDNMIKFSHWKNKNSILEQHEIYVYPRPDKANGQQESHPHVKWVEAPILRISATYIRKAIKNHKSIRYLVPQAVERIIKAKKFYLS